MTDDVAAAPESAGGELMAALLDLSSPQPNYKQMIDGPGLLQPSDGVVLTLGRELTEYVLRHHELFSSRVEMGLGNVRPLIPLNVDPPLHSKYRKLLDPLFAPKRMDEQEEDIIRRVVALI
jgi:cytochrome P450